MPEHALTLQGWAGIHNAGDQYDIPITDRLAYLKSAINVDIDDKRMLHRRQGRSRVYTGTPRQIWPQVDVGITYSIILEGSSMKQLNPDFGTPITLLTGLDAVSLMDFVYVNGRVYYTNPNVIGYIKDGVATALAAPAVSKQFKRTLKPGTYIEFYKSRLYTAHGSVMSFSDATRIYRMDSRYNQKQFDGEITMMRMVNDGMYVSAGKYTYFLSGASPEKMTPVKVTESPAFHGSGVKVEAQKLLPDAKGFAVYWESKEGIFVGLSGGDVTNVTWHKWSPPIIPNRTSATCKNDRGYWHYVCAYEYPTMPGFEISGRFPAWSGVVTVS